MAFLDDSGVRKLVSLLLEKINSDFVSKNTPFISDTEYKSKALYKTVNGQPAEVVVSASTLKSDMKLNNVANVLQYSESNPPPYPVTSVNGSTGAVTIAALPTVTASDNGKVLRVVSGAWAASSLPSANGVSF